MEENTPLTPLSDLELHALLDGALPPHERQVLESRLAIDPDGRLRLATWRAQRSALQALHRELLADPIPATLLEAAGRLGASRQRASSWWRWGGMAAGLLLAFGAGWSGRGLWPVDLQTARTSARLLPAFVHEAALAHAVFSPEKRHPVEVGASDEAHLVQWLSRRTGKALKVPQLLAQGYELVGGRLLPGDAGARAQFMFQNAQGVRITLYLGAVASEGAGQAAGETAFAYSAKGPVPGFYWVDQGFGYALSGPLGREALLALAEAVHGQL